MPIGALFWDTELHGLFRNFQDHYWYFYTRIKHSTLQVLKEKIMK